MEENQHVVLHGLSSEARRNLVDTSSLTPRDKENARANSTRNSSFSDSTFAGDAKASLTSSSSTHSTGAVAVPTPARTPSRFGFSHHAPRPGSTTPTLFNAQTPSPASISTNRGIHQQTAQQLLTRHLGPVATTPNHQQQFGAQKSPPGTSQVLRKHFQSIGLATPPPGSAHHSQQQHHRLLSSGAIRTPNHLKQAHKVKSVPTYNPRVGIDGTTYTPSKELLKSTSSSRHQRVDGLQDVSMDHHQHLALLEQQQHQDESEEVQHMYLHHHINPTLHPRQEMMDDEASASTNMDDASFDISLPSMTTNQALNHHNTHHPFHGISSSLSPSAPKSLSPMAPRMGCLNPVAMTLLNDGEEDYQYLMEEDTDYPMPGESPSQVVNSGFVATNQQQRATNTSMSSNSATSSLCLSPCNTPAGSRSVQQSPAQVSGTLSHTVRSSLAYPVAIMPKAGRDSPTSNGHHSPRLIMRPQPKHVR